MYVRLLNLDAQYSLSRGAGSDNNCRSLGSSSKRENTKSGTVLVAVSQWITPVFSPDPSSRRRHALRRDRYSTRDCERS